LIIERDRERVNVERATRAKERADDKRERERERERDREKTAIGRRGQNCY